jgi:hypothetical protein
MLETFEFETFEGRVGERFRVHFEPGRPDELELVEAERGGDAAPGARAPFSLVFAVRSEVVHPQQIYRVDHDELGSFELFLVPIAPDERGTLYEAVFA